MAKGKRSPPKHVAELSILRLAALGIDVRQCLAPDEIRRIPSLEMALIALDQVMVELGWGDQELRKEHGRQQVKARAD